MNSVIDIVRRYLIAGWQIMELVGRDTTKTLVAANKDADTAFEAQRKLILNWTIDRHKTQSDSERAALDSALEAALLSEPDFVQWLEDNTVTMEMYRAMCSPTGVAVYPPANQIN